MGQQVVTYLVTFISVLTEIVVFMIFIRIIMSWLRMPATALTRFITNSTDPIMQLARRITPRTGMIDLSPIVALFGVQLIRSGLVMLIAKIAPFIINWLG